MCVCMCACMHVHVHVCEFVEQSLIKAWSLPTGKREVAVGRGSAFVPPARQREHRAKGGMAKSHGMT